MVVGGDRRKQRSFTCILHVHFGRRLIDDSMNLLLLPLLAVHVLFLAYALIKRVLNVLGSTPAKYARPPKHLALVVVPGSSRRVPLSLLRQHEDEAAFVSSVETALDHCAALRIPELSIWDTGRGGLPPDLLTPGLTQRCMSRLEHSVMAVDKLTGGTHSPRRVCERTAEDENKVETWHVEISSRSLAVLAHQLAKKTLEWRCTFCQQLHRRPTWLQSHRTGLSPSSSSTEKSNKPCILSTTQSFSSSTTCALA